MKVWTALHVCEESEYKAHARLSLAPYLESFYPEETWFDTDGAMRTEYRKPLVPGYLFIRACPSDWDWIAGDHAALGFARGVDGAPVIIEDEMMERFIAAVRSGAWDNAARVRRDERDRKRKRPRRAIERMKPEAREALLAVLDQVRIAPRDRRQRPTAL